MIVTIFFAIILVVVYFTINKENTNSEFINIVFLRQFYHANLQHLLSNLILFVIISLNLEKQYGSNYLVILLAIIYTNSILFFVLTRLFPSLDVVTIGFSGVVYSLMVIFTLSNRNNFLLVLPIVGIVIISSVIDRQISLLGHIIGLFVGMCFYYATRSMLK